MPPFSIRSCLSFLVNGDAKGPECKKEKTQERAVLPLKRGFRERKKKSSHEKGSGQTKEARC